jgi:transcriptional regulator with XRE-family HTH domain
MSHLDEVAKKTPQHVAARQWREAKGLSRAALSERVGYSVSAIQNYELGEVRENGSPIGDREWLRYKLACAAIDAEIEFNWGIS